MRVRRSNRVVGSVVASSVVAAGVLAGAVGASAMAAERESSTPASARIGEVEKVEPEVRKGDIDMAARGAGLASTSSPFIPGVWHVPSNVLLGVDATGEAVYLAPEGSIFDGPFDEVNDRVDAWWADQLASGLTTETADKLLAHAKQ
jgi:hypothetical protein